MPSADRPLISVVTPSFQQAQYLETTLRSVLGQGYPRLEYLVLDGGSTDGSEAILRRYAPRLAFWASQPDSGQAAAINQGFARARGDLLTWINSDDWLLPGALASAAQAYQHQPGALLLGDTLYYAESDGYVLAMPQRDVTLACLMYTGKPGSMWHQPGTFIPREVWTRVGPLDEGLHYAFDRDWMCRALAAGTPVAYLGGPAAVFRLQAASKTADKLPAWGDERHRVTERYRALAPGLTARQAEAEQAIWDATVRLHYQFMAHWDAGGARRALWRGVRADPRLAANRTYWHLWVRALAPRALVAWARERWIRRQTPAVDSLLQFPGELGA